MSPRTSNEGKKAPSEDEKRSVEEVGLNNALEDYGTALTKLGQNVRQCLRGQPQSKTLLAAAPPPSWFRRLVHANHSQEWNSHGPKSGTA